MVKVTTPEIGGQSGGRAGRTKAEPIVTRSVAAREAAANHIPGSPPSVRTRNKQKQAAAAAAAASSIASNSTGSSSSAPASSVGSRATTPSPVLGRLPPGLDCHSYAKSPILKDPNNSDDGQVGKLDGYEADRGESDMEDSCVITQHGVMGGPEGESMNLGQIQGDQLTTVKDNSVKIEISVSDEKEGLHMPTTVASTDVTKPLIIQTKFSTSPGPSSESTDTASEVGSGMNSPVCSTSLSGQPSPNIPRHHRFRGEEAIKAAEGLLLQHKLETGQHLLTHNIKGEPATPGSADGTKDGGPSSNIKQECEVSPRSKFSSQQGFTPKVTKSLVEIFGSFGVGISAIKGHGHVGP